MGPGLGLAFSKVTVPQALHWIFPEVSAVIAQVWPQTQSYSVDFLPASAGKSRLDREAASLLVVLLTLRPNKANKHVKACKSV